MDWTNLAGCRCPWCFGQQMYGLPARLVQFPWPVRVGLGFLRDDVIGTMTIMDAVWAGIQMPNSEVPGGLFHVFQGVPLRPGLDPRRQARDILGILLVHEVDEGLELEGVRVYEPHGKDSQEFLGPRNRVYLGGTI